MKRKKIYILGAGNLAKDVVDIYKTLDRKSEIKGFIVERSYCTKKRQMEGMKIFEDSIIGQLDEYTTFIAAIGLPKRKDFIEQIRKKGFGFETLIHPSAIIGNNVSIGTGSIVFAGTILTRDIKIGEHVIVNVNCSISHDCKIGDYITISPGVNIAGHVTIGASSFIGIGAAISNDVSIGKNVAVGAGAVVLNDIPDNVVAAGVPAKPIKKCHKLELGRAGMPRNQP